VRSEVCKEAIDIDVPFLFEGLPNNLRVEIQKMRMVEHEEKAKWEMEK
jgi:hypothetical protein